MTEIKNTSVIDYQEISDEDFANLIDGSISTFNEGDLVTGKVVKIEHDEVLVDIGFKSEGVIPARELSIRKDVDPSTCVELGQEIQALVLTKEDKDGRLVLSKKRAEYEVAWKQVEEKFKAGEIVTGEVIEVVKGGLIVDIGLRGFLPASLVDMRRVRELDSYLNTEVDARIIEMDRNRNNVVLSRRVLLEEGRKAERAEILSKLSKGMRLKGTVSSIVEFGAFVDLGGIDGLVHISELSWNHVNHPSEVVSVGDELEVVVLDVDLDRERISLGLKQTQPDPWTELMEKYPQGMIVDGKVTNVVTFGAFVEFAPNVEGLVHISELATQHIDSPKQVVHAGDQVKVKIVEYDLEKRRISLSCKAAAEELGFDIKVEGAEAPADKGAEASEESAE
ncbi:MAG: 30S ribosomal protein S1 [Phoenicibacter congonensis]|uniref:30S ribosomal protein S1 n=1 Tax=Phoenicibacter congonensis TaxID=1944646 RepID=A0AA43RGQ0_9ACTN|nr:30S ribosomal protein S1 [Phoenicibacter congonensis]